MITRCEQTNNVISTALSFHLRKHFVLNFLILHYFILKLYTHTLYTQLVKLFLLQKQMYMLRKLSSNPGIGTVSLGAAFLSGTNDSDLREEPSDVDIVNRDKENALFVQMYSNRSDFTWKERLR